MITGNHLVIACPIATCDWRHLQLDEPVPPGALAEVFGFGVVAQVSAHQRAQAVEDALEKHLKTHSLVEWVTALREARERVDAEWVAVVTGKIGPDTAAELAGTVKSVRMHAAAPARGGSAVD